MATANTISFGDGAWGINSDQTGLIINSYSYDYKSDSGQVENRTGNVVGKTYYNQTITFSIDGLIPKTSPWSTALATSITLSNGLSALLNGGLNAAGLNIVEGITTDYSNKDYAKMKITGTYYPSISA